MGRYTEHVVGKPEFQDAISRISAGTPVKLTPEPGNPYDPRAIAAVAKDAGTVGYLTSDSWLVGAMLDDGMQVASRVAEIVGGKLGQTRGVILDVRTAEDAVAALAGNAVSDGSLRELRPPPKPGCVLYGLMAGLALIIGLIVLGSVLPRSPKSNRVANSDMKSVSLAAAKIQPFISFGYDLRKNPELAKDLRKKLGKKGFETLNALDRGAYLAAAESDQCDKVTSAGVPEDVTAANLYWLVDCENENRFKVSAAQARMALTREKNPAAADPAVPRETAPACTFRNVDACNSSAGQAGEIDEGLQRLTAEGAGRALKASMRNPDSLVIESGSASRDGKLLCVEYRAQNGFGGMNREYIAYLNGKPKSGAGFWNSHCTKGDFTDVGYLVRAGAS